MTTTTQNPYADMSAAQLARQESYARNLQDARTSHNKKEKQQHAEGIARGMGSSANVGNNKKNTPQTDAQKKSILKRAQKRYAKKRSIRKKKKILIRHYSKSIKRYDKTPWTLMYAAVAGNLIGGLFTGIGIGYLFIIPCTLFIDVMVWKALNKKDRIEVRALIIVSTGIKFIPIVSMLPASAYLVYLTKKKAQKRKNESIEKIKKLSVV